MPKVEKIQCLVRMNYDGNANLTQVLRSGPSAAYAFEIPLMRRMNDLGMDLEGADCAVTEAEVVGDQMMTLEQIRTHLRRKYKQNVIDAIYPGGRGYALTLADCELPDTSIVRKVEPVNINTVDQALIRRLKGVDEPLSQVIVQNGPYESLDELLKIEGITARMIEGWKKSPGVVVIPVPEVVE